MDIMPYLPLVLIGAFMLVIGLLSIRQYFEVRRSAVDVAVSRYQLHMFVRIYRGKQAQVRAKDYLWAGAFYILIGGIAVGASLIGAMH